MEIEKTFSSTFINLIIYLWMLYYFLNFNTNYNNTEFHFDLKKLVQEKFMKEDFPFEFTIYDYSTENSENNYDINSYSWYKIRTNLKEVQEFSQIFAWIKDFYFDQLGFYMKPNQNKKNFLNKFPVYLCNKIKLIGKMRFLQLRQENMNEEKCQPYSLLANDYNETMSTYCYSDYTANQKNSSRFFTYNDVNKMTAERDVKFKQECEKNMSYFEECEILNGFKYRDINESYTYIGGIQEYLIDGGFYFDLPMINKDNDFDYLDYKFIIDFLNSYWIDLSTRLVMVSFNSLDTNNLQSIFTVK